MAKDYENNNLEVEDMDLTLDEVEGVNDFEEENASTQNQDNPSALLDQNADGESVADEDETVPEESIMQDANDSDISEDEPADEQLVEDDEDENFDSILIEKRSKNMDVVFKSPKSEYEERLEVDHTIETEEKESSPSKTISTVDMTGYETEEGTRIKEYNDLVELRITQKPTKGKIARLPAYEGPRGNYLGVNALIYYGKSNYNVLIPIEEFTERSFKKPEYDSFKSEMVEPHLLAKAYIRQHMFVDIKYCITSVHREKDQNGKDIVIAMGSRVRAMRRDERNYYFNAPPARRIENGDVVYGTIVACYPSRLIVDVGGKEVEIPKTEVDWVPHVNLNEEAEYAPGSIIKVVVTSLEKNMETQRVESITCSAKLTKPDPRIENCRKFNVKDEVAGVCVQNYPTGSLISLNDQEMTCFVVFSTQFGRPENGQSVIVIIDDVDLVRNRLTGHIRSKLPIRK